MSALACPACELEPGDRFSPDRGATWLQLESDPRYVDPDAGDTLRLLVSREWEPGVRCREVITLEDGDSVLLQRW